MRLVRALAPPARTELSADELARRLDVGVARTRLERVDPLARAGLVFLTQRRIGSRHYEYIATKASRPLPQYTWSVAYE